MPSMPRYISPGVSPDTEAKAPSSIKEGKVASSLGFRELFSPSSSSAFFDHKCSKIDLVLLKGIDMGDLYSKIRKSVLKDYKEVKPEGFDLLVDYIVLQQLGSSLIQLKCILPITEIDVGGVHAVMRGKQIVFFSADASHKDEVLRNTKDILVAKPSLSADEKLFLELLDSETCLFATDEVLAALAVIAQQIATAVASAVSKITELAKATSKGSVVLSAKTKKKIDGIVRAKAIDKLVLSSLIVSVLRGDKKARKQLQKIIEKGRAEMREATQKRKKEVAKEIKEEHERVDREALKKDIEKDERARKELRNQQR
jgi:hypothetical protein